MPSTETSLTKKIIMGALLILMVVALAGCAAPNNVAHLHETHISGFWGGLWDGMTACLAFIIHLLGGHTGIYEVHNDGGWYDFGFLIGIGAFTKGLTSGVGVSYQRR